MGGLSGKWNITKSAHKIDRGGYTTDFEAKLISASTGTGKQATVGEVLFDTDKSVLRTEGIAEVERMVVFMQENPNAIMEIGGHTDSDATEDYNLALSERRANAVRDYMIGKGVFATRLTAKGYGENQPVASNATADGKQKNRRTEFVVVQNN
jgi:outer membrane protein OmpA-like peptidoglycan-associated protein